MTALIALILLAHFHLIGLALAICAGIFLIYLAFVLVCAVFAIPFALFKWIGSKISFTEPAQNEEWKHKVDRWVVAGMIIFTPLFLTVACLSKFFR